MAGLADQPGHRVSAYLLVTAAGVLVIGYQGVQTRYALADLRLRLVIGPVAHLSW